VDSIESENQHLRHRVVELEKTLERMQGEICEAVARGAGGGRLLAWQFVAMELQHGELATLYVASTRLQATLKRQELLAAIREIVTNLIGAEEMALFENNPETSTLSLIDSYGNASATDPVIRLGEGPVGRVALTGHCYFYDTNRVGQEPSDADMPTACVPLKVDGAVWGVIVIYRLLPQKDCIVELDYQLFNLLSTLAGVALRCAELNAKRTAAWEASV
jgi:GAF domain-containing protein